jgi:hypothetical protein
MEYQDFTLELLTGSVDRTFDVRWRFGHQSGVARTELPSGIENLSWRVLNHIHEPLPPEEIQRLSDGLARLLFPDDVREAFDRAEEDCRSSDKRLRLRIVAEDEPFARLPFEFVGHPYTRNPLLLDPFCSLTRRVTGPLVPFEPVEDRPLRILLAGASPHAENLARIDIEAQTVLIRGALRPLAQEKRVTMQVLLQATPE